MEYRSALLVIVPEAEPLVGPLRAALDGNAALGVRAHVTVMAPFLPPAEIDDGVHAALREIAAGVPAFDVRFAGVGWFDESVWLVPEPAAPFVTLTRAVAARFGLRPYGGEYGDDVVPHLTVGHRAPAQRLRAAAAEVERGLPLMAPVRTLSLLTGTEKEESWRVVAEFPLTG
ncbi:hypothetical protein BJF78_04905 [Pseudonocardia sp. CNS-139]|nr:hypothetical protein BJF78_04905 [Pseudonocardia sp. CNS-139]